MDHVHISCLSRDEIIAWYTMTTSFESDMKTGEMGELYFWIYSVSTTF